MNMSFFGKKYLILFLSCMGEGEGVQDKNIFHL